MNLMNHITITLKDLSLHDFIKRFLMNCLRPTPQDKMYTTYLSILEGHMSRWVKDFFVIPRYKTYKTKFSIQECFSFCQNGTATTPSLYFSTSGSTNFTTCISQGSQMSCIWCEIYAKIKNTYNFLHKQRPV